jgi:hypothetical protein
LRIYEFLASGGLSEPAGFVPPSQFSQPPPFAPPSWVIWVNTLWFVNLLINLYAGLLAMLQQQWTTRYLRLTQSLDSTPAERALFREFYANGVKKSWLPLVAEIPSTLMQISLFIFFAGLLIFLFNYNNNSFYSLVPFVTIATLTYLTFSFMPLFWPDTPYHTPLTPLLRLVMFVDKTSEETIRNLVPEIDDRILRRSCFNALAPDHELDQFFQGVLGFCSSKFVKEPNRIMHALGDRSLSFAMIEFLKHTRSSKSLSDLDKIRRFVTCVKVADAVRLSDVALSILDIFPCDRRSAFRSVAIGHFLTRRGKNSDQEIGLFAQSIVAQIIADIQRNDDRWFRLATNQLGDSLPLYLQHGADSVLLANFIHITRRTRIIASLGDVLSQGMVEASLNIQATLTNFDIQKTLPELQRDFLSLWDQVNRDAPNNGALTKILDNLVPLHEVLKDVFIVPPASGAGLPDNSSNSISPVHKVANESAHTPPFTPSTDSRHDAATATVAPIAPFASPDKLSPAEATAPEPPETHGLSGNSLAVASAATATANNVDDSGEAAVPHLSTEISAA